MAQRSQGGAALRSSAPAAKPEQQGRQKRQLEVAQQPATARRSISDVGTLLALGLFVACLALAALHAVLVENQASLDNLIEQNQQRQEHIDTLQAEIAYLDSPEGLADQADSAGLVPAAELVVLRTVAPGLLAPPEDDPFSLQASGWTPAEPVDPPADSDPDPAAGAPAPGSQGE